MNMSESVAVNEIKFRVHPVYYQYATSKCGKIINIDLKNIILGNLDHSGYLHCSVRAKNTKVRKTVQVHRFVYECYHGIIPDSLVIDHINDERIDNRLCNLQLLTTKENCIKAGKNRITRSPPREVVAINLTTGDRHYFSSMSCAGKELGFVPKLIQEICENRRRSTRSKFDDYWYRFEYLD